MIEARVAVLEREMQDARIGLAQANLKLDLIAKNLNEMSGGKKAVFGLFAIVGAFIAAGAAVISAAIAIWPKIH